jgi:hypothetical protein
MGRRHSGTPVTPDRCGMVPPAFSRPTPARSAPAPAAPRGSGARKARSVPPLAGRTSGAGTRNQRGQPSDHMSGSDTQEPGPGRDMADQPGPGGSVHRGFHRPRQHVGERTGGYPAGKARARVVARTGPWPGCHSSRRTIALPSSLALADKDRACQAARSNSTASSASPGNASPARQLRRGHAATSSARR